MQIRISTALVAALLLASCYNRAGEKTAQEKPVARVGKATLSRSDIVANVPPGMSEADSIEYVRRYVNNWVDCRYLIWQKSTAVWRNTAVTSLRPNIVAIGSIQVPTRHLPTKN